MTHAYNIGYDQATKKYRKIIERLKAERDEARWYARQYRKIAKINHAAVRLLVERLEAPDDAP